MRIHKEGFATILYSFILLAIILLGLYYFFPNFLHFGLLICTILFIFILSFFRVPTRPVKDYDPNVLISPCDGKVVVIEKTFESEYLKSECVMISIFMSPLNVHVNWHPISGNIEYTQYHPGKYLVAWDPKASTENERNTVSYMHGGKRILLRQIAGAMARRIVSYPKIHDSVNRANELGFIKFGSRVDVFLPLGSEISVKLGDRVRGQISVLGKL
ncbi:MAG: phosphatidylserine decarboxylase family protein [Saprospiraceae bacterium]|nr:phosphatidylserine decarboxylase family protein [Saprospiraceae bacterium]